MATSAFAALLEVAGMATTESAAVTTIATATRRLLCGHDDRNAGWFLRAGDANQFWIRWTDVYFGQLYAGAVSNPVYALLLLVCSKRDDYTGSASARGATSAVQIIFVIRRCINVHDE
jgi:hypothetical protein